VFTTTEDNNKDDIFVYGDTGGITEVISNLLSNAIKFTEEGTITAKIEKRIDKNNQEQIVTVISVLLLKRHNKLHFIQNEDQRLIRDSSILWQETERLENIFTMHYICTTMSRKMIKHR
jgi:hypothetical protein